MQHTYTPATTWDELRTTQQGHTPDYGTWYGYEASMSANQRRHWARQRAIRDGHLFPLDRPCIARLVPSAESDTAA